MTRKDPIVIPITVTLQALAQDNGDGTWTVAVPKLTYATVTSINLAEAIWEMSDLLSTPIKERDYDFIRTD